MAVRPKERMWFTAGGERLVPAGDPDAAYQAPKEFTEAEAKRLGLKAVDPVEDKAVAGPAAKKNRD